jgi:hypothetical protein
MIRRHFSFPSIFPNYVSSSIVIAPNLFILLMTFFSLSSCVLHILLYFPFISIHSVSSLYGFVSSFALLGPTLTTSFDIASVAYHHLLNRDGFHRKTHGAI